MRRRPPVSNYHLPRSRFLSGAATAFNLAGNFYSYNFCDNGPKADVRALRADFAVIGEDIRKALRSHAEHNSPK